MKKWKSFLLICISFITLGAFAAYGDQDTTAEPEIHSEGAVLMNAETGEILYEKNGDTRFYPASITKLMTALLTVENCDLSDTVTFSSAATSNLEAGSVSLKISGGDKLSVKDCLYGLLLKSANEIGNGLAEHIAGSNAQFAQMMNTKAKALGCTNTNFTNPHGLNDSNHYTTPADMALIAKEAFKNPTLCLITGTTSYPFPAVQKAEAHTISMGHKMIYPSDSRYYSGIIGGKTGYTSKAGNTLVTCAQRDGIKLIAVIMKSKSTHYADTKALLDYGFAIKGRRAATGPSDVANHTSPTSPYPTNDIGPDKGTVGSSATINYSLESPGGSYNSSPMASGNNNSYMPPNSGNGSSPMASANNNSYIPPNNSNGSSPMVSGNPASSPLSPSSGSSPASNETEGWHRDTEGWYYIKSDGQKAAGQWLTINGASYWFDSDTHMATGWRQMSNGTWYYLRSDGTMAVNSWRTNSSGNWFYLGSDGAMLINTTTPDGFKLGANGAWIP